MSNNIVLGSAVRQNLLALQNLNSQIGTSENHLSTGLKVASAVDDAVSFFQSQALVNRADDLNLRKSTIDQAISSLTTATQAAQSVVTILQQLQGILNSAQTQTGAQLTASKNQYDQLTTQLNNLVGDASYQGLNLVNSASSTLSVQFSLLTSSTLTVTGSDLTYGTLISTADTSLSVPTTSGSGAANALLTAVGATGGFTAATAAQFQQAFNVLQNAINTVQGDAQQLGGNITFLQTRLSFTQQYATTLQGGSDKLVLADTNVESTNLVTLQTRQQLSIQSLSIATSSEQAVLRLFH